MSGSPIWASRRWTASETAGWVRASLTAAREKLFSVATARNICKAWRSMHKLRSHGAGRQH